MMRFVELRINDNEFVLRPADAEQMVDAYIRHCERRLKPISAKKYAQRIAHFIAWANQYEFITEGDFNSFPAYLESVGLNFNTRTDCVLRVKQAFEWAHGRGATFNIAQWMPTIRGDRPIRKAATVTDVQKLLEVAEGNIRDAAVIAVLAGTGMRRAELTGLDLTDVTFDAQGGGEMVIRHAKGGRSRIAVFDAGTGAYLTRWIAKRGNQTGALVTGQKPGPNRDYRLTPNVIYHMVVKYAHRAGVRNRIRGCHDLRRVFITEWLRTHKANSGSTLLLMKQVGHSSLTMTALYDLRGAEDIKQLMGGRQ
jgi:integrase